MHIRWSVAVFATVLVLAACGGDDGAGVRDLGGSASSGSGSGSGSGSVASGSGSVASGSEVAECIEVGDASEAGSTVAVTLEEFAVSPDPDSAPAGAVAFEANNTGEDVHELVVVQAPSIEDLPLAEDDTVDEEALEPGAFIGEIEGFPSGESCTGTFDLTAGDYVLFCNILEDHEGTLENHFQLGMATEFTVE